MGEIVVQTMSWAQAFSDVGIAFAIVFGIVGATYCVMKY